MIAATVETGQRNMAVLEQSVIKDNTLMPGEWYGGQLHLAPPTDQGGGQKIYTIVITVGTDRHVIDVVSGAGGSMKQAQSFALLLICAVGWNLCVLSASLRQPFGMPRRDIRI